VSEGHLPPDIAVRLVALEQQVAHLYAELGLVAPSMTEAVLAAIGGEAQQLVRDGRRAEAIREVMVAEGVSQAAAIARVDAFSRTLGR